LIDLFGWFVYLSLSNRTFGKISKCL
jgi:hypothetical protein